MLWNKIVLSYICIINDSKVTGLDEKAFIL